MRFLWYGFLALFSLGMIGLALVVGGAIYTISYFGRDLPDYTALKDYEPPVVTRVYATDGRLLTEFAEEKRVFTPIEAIPPVVKNAFISAEDKNFYNHDGIDYVAIARAGINNLKNSGSGKRPVGASTITQQVAKNFLLSNELSYKRKIREAILAFRMERAMSKERLLELYLNEIYLGEGTYGVAAAALNYFNKSLDELSIAEAAFLGALPKAPNNYHPVRRHTEAVARRNWVIGRMEEDGYITHGQAELARAAPLDAVRDQSFSVIPAPYFAEEVRRELKEKYGQGDLYGGGLVVRTSIDPRLQEIAVRALRDGLVAYDRRHGWRGPLKHLGGVSDWQAQLEKITPPAGMPDDWKLAIVLKAGTAEASIGLFGGTQDKIPLKYLTWAKAGAEAARDVLRVGDVIMVASVEDEGKKVWGLRQIPAVNGAIVALDPHTGRVLAMQGGWSYRESEFNRATQALRQPGSAFKPFVYLTALEKGFTPATLILDDPAVYEQGPGLPLWRPTNYTNEFYGPTPLRVGVEKSRNLMTVRLADFVGMEAIADTVKKFGVMDNLDLHLANCLGSGETTLLRMTTGYAQFVNGGKKIAPSFIDRVQDRRGKTVFKHDDRACEGCGPVIPWNEGLKPPVIPDTREQIADPRRVYQMVSIMEGVVQRGTATKLKPLNRPLAGKTGTTNDSKDTWFIGFSPDLVVGVFVGFDEPKPMGKKETGAAVAVPVFKDFMEEALKDAPPLPFRVPPGIRQVQINADTGARARPGDEHVIWESFLTGTEPTDQMYILDTDGIRPTNSFGDWSASEGVFPGTPGAPVSGGTTGGGAVTTGTGGLY